jgi:predicted GNAT family acetyltransferase
MEIHHDSTEQSFWTEIDDQRAEADYEVSDGTLSIYHTFVPQSLEGRGIASQLVAEAYNYALSSGLRPAATCSYALSWLKKHPDYLAENQK